LQPSSLLQIEDLCIDFQTLKAVNNLSFSIQAGEIYGLLGPNGAGKSSTIGAITTLIKPTSGKIWLDGKEIKGVARWAKKLIGVVPQEIINYAFFTVEEVMRIHANFHKISKSKEKIELWLKKLALWDHRKKKAARLSGGMKRRLAIAKALLHGPKLLLLDEPSAGVDIELREVLWELTKELKESGVAILFTTHYLDEAERLCDRVALMDHGKLIMEKSTKELIESAQKRVEILLKESLENLEHPYLDEINSKTLSFQMPNSVDIGSLIHELPFDLSLIADIRVKVGTLEDVFKRELKL